MTTLEAYVDRQAELINLPLDPSHRPGVIANFEKIAELAQLVTEFSLPETIEVAPMFQP